MGDTKMSLFYEPLIHRRLLGFPSKDAFWASSEWADVAGGQAALLLSPQGENLPFLLQVE